MKILYHLFFIVTLAGFSGCDPGSSSASSKALLIDKIDKIDNEYLKIDRRDDGLANYEIRKSTKVPLLVKNGALIEIPKLEDISHTEFLGSSFLLLPSEHKFARHFAENPFQDQAPLLGARASLWGHELVPLKTEHNNILYKIGKELSKPELSLVSNQKLAELFGDYKKHSLGKGGQGEVFKITYKGKDYALKSNAQEAVSMEKLQFTDGVAKIYAMFNANDNTRIVPFMIMEVGKESLNALNDRAEKLSVQQVVDAAKRFERLLDAQEVLKITNTDIKPHNLLLTQDGRLVVIDIAAATTRGYSGSESALLARALLENQRNLSLTGGYIALDRFFEFVPQYRSINIASPVLISAWYKAMCKELFPTQTACSQVKDYDALFALFNKPMLFEIGEEINKNYKDQTGTHDTKEYGLYNTNLPLPNVQDILQDDWKAYFSKRNEIGAKFCEQFEYVSKNPTGVSVFFEPLKTSYSAFCQQQPDKAWVFLKAFKDFQDPDFRTWILDALSPGVKLETFKQLAKTGPSLDSLYEGIIKSEVDVVNDPVGKAIFKLFRYKTAAE